VKDAREKRSSHEGAGEKRSSNERGFYWQNTSPMGPAFHFHPFNLGFSRSFQPFLLGLLYSDNPW